MSNYALPLKGTGGADPRMKNKDGQTPERAARKRGLFDATDLLARRKQTG
jgi:hypothetical protein